MPSGKTHNKINFIFLPVFLFGLVVVGFASFKYAFVFSTGYIFGTLYLDPDLDIKGKSFKRWGFLNFIWVPYQKLFPHRSIFTHGLILGDIGRITYLLAWLYLLFVVPTSIVRQLWLPFYHQNIIKNTTLQFICVVVAVLLVLLCVFRIRQKKLLITLISICIVTAICINCSFSVSTWILHNLTKNPYYAYYLIIGIVLSSTIHIMADIVVSSIKKLTK